MQNRIYLCIDLKSFYASVECMERGLDPMDTNLVVADESRTGKTICLAVTPSLKARGVPGRPRLFEVVQKVAEMNAIRRGKLYRKDFSGKSFSDSELKKSPTLEIDYIIAPPRMAYYIQYSTKIHDVYLKYIAPEDIHVYSIDEVFIDISAYLKIRKQSPREFAMEIINDVYTTTGITATAGIGTNMYLAKVAMDIVAKHMPADENGVRIAELDEISYRKTLWNHTPLTDFWRIGRGISKKLEHFGLDTMGKIAHRSLENEEFFYDLFGINAELLIDHAWGYEPCEISNINGYKPENRSLGRGQVLHTPYDYKKARLIVKEMADQLVLEMVEKGIVSNQMVLTVGYDTENISKGYQGETVTDRYGRKIPKHAHGTQNISKKCSSSKIIINAFTELFDRIVDKDLLIRRLTLTVANVLGEKTAEKQSAEQLDLFYSSEESIKQRESEADEMEKERRMQEAVINLRKKYGKNAVLKGMNLQEGATAKDRNSQIGGHKA